MADHAHQQLVEKAIDWKPVEKALTEYPHIGKYFSLCELKEAAPSPYFCHYLAWRINRWEESQASERYLWLFDRLISEAEKLEGWEGHERFKDASYESYWSILWELQVADAFSRHPRICKVQWLADGPDLEVSVRQAASYAECYVYMKSYAALTYIKELLWSLSPHFEVCHRVSVSMRLPTGQQLPKFLDQLFKPFLDGGQYLARLQKEARNHGRADVCVPAGACNLRIYLSDPVTLARPDPNNAHGAGASFGEGFVVDAIQKALQNKKEKNALASHRPNVLLVNCPLSVDYVADLHQTLAFYKGRLPDCALKDTQDALDAACFFAQGVDRKLCLCSGQPVYRDHPSHPLACILIGPGSGKNQ